MAYIIGFYTAILALAVWQENSGSAALESDVGSDRCSGCGNH
ncbi:hypothetical protein [Pseudohalioglobus lutimaris]|nr:hypothetical protein [Pseudohalioglobus lutimaris]